MLIYTDYEFSVHEVIKGNTKQDERSSLACPAPCFF